MEDCRRPYPLVCPVCRHAMIGRGPPPKVRTLIATAASIAGSLWNFAALPQRMRKAMSKKGCALPPAAKDQGHSFPHGDVG